MNLPLTIVPLELENHTQSYELNVDKFRALKNAAVEKIIAYDLNYGHYLLEHLNRTSTNLKGFMIHQGIDEGSAEKVSNAFWFHDIGKLLQPLYVHEFTDTPPSAEILQERKKHPALGKTMLRQLIQETGISITDQDAPHLDTAIYLMETHHERMNGSGPLKYTGHRMDRVLRMATIVDEVDGKTKKEKYESRADIFNDITSRSALKFDMDLVGAYDRFCKEKSVLPDLKALRDAAFSQPLAPAPVS